MFLYAKTYEYFIYELKQSGYHDAFQYNCTEYIVWNNIQIMKVYMDSQYLINESKIIISNGDNMRKIVELLTDDEYLIKSIIE